MRTGFIIAALVCFILPAFGLTTLTVVSLVPLGLAFYMASHLAKSP